MASQTRSQCLLSSSSTIVEIKIERDSDDVPQHTPQDLVGFQMESESTAASHGPGGIKTEPVDAVLIEIEIEPHSGFKNNEIKNEPSELSGERSFNTYHMKFEIDEEGPVCPAPDTEMVTKQDKDVSKDVTSMQTSVADKLKPAAGSTTNRKQCKSRRGSTTLTDQGPHQCEVCQRRFKYRSRLMLHYRTHTMEKPFPCNDCGRRFSHKVSLISHITTHTGEKPFHCKECGSRYNYKPSLLLHMRSAHTEKKLMCEVCQRTFSLKHHLLSHMRTHIEVKLLKCNKCQRAFSDKATISRHLQICIGNKPCPKKPFRFCL